MLTVKGTTFKGCGNASRCIEKQKVHLKPYIAEIDTFHSGTINIKLEQPVSFKKYDVKTQPIRWCENAFEWIAFVRASFFLEVEKFKSPIPCLIYIGETSPYTHDPMRVEIMTPFIENLSMETKCSLIFNQPENIKIG